MPSMPSVSQSVSLRHSLLQTELSRPVSWQLTSMHVYQLMFMLKVIGNTRLAKLLTSSHKHPCYTLACAVGASCLCLVISACTQQAWFADRTLYACSAEGHAAGKAHQGPYCWCVILLIPQSLNTQRDQSRRLKHRLSNNEARNCAYGSPCLSGTSTAFIVSLSTHNSSYTEHDSPAWACVDTVVYLNLSCILCHTYSQTVQAKMHTCYIILC